MHSKCTVLTRLCMLISSLGFGGDWMQFRGPGGLGVSEDKGLPVTWSSQGNLLWQVDLPGPGASSPIVVADRVYLTSYSGYGLEPAKGEQSSLRRHLHCFDRDSGKEVAPFKRGGFLIAEKAKVPIIPIAISGTYDLLPAGKLMLKPGEVTISILPPIEVKTLDSSEIKGLREVVREKIIAELEK